MRPRGVGATWLLGLALAAAFLGARWVAAARKRVVGDDLDRLWARVFWSAAVGGSGVAVSAAVWAHRGHLVLGAWLSALCLTSSALILLFSRRLGALRFSLALAAAVALVAGAVTAVLVAVRMDGLTQWPWSLVLLPAWLALPCVMITLALSCVFISRSRGACWPLWDCARGAMCLFSFFLLLVCLTRRTADHAEGLSLTVAGVVLTLLLLPAVLSASLLVPPLDAGRAVRSFSLCLLPLDLLLLALAVSSAVRLLKSQLARPSV